MVQNTMHMIVRLWNKAGCVRWSQRVEWTTGWGCLSLTWATIEYRIKLECPLRWNIVFGSLLQNRGGGEQSWHVCRHTARHNINPISQWNSCSDIMYYQWHHKWLKTGLPQSWLVIFVCVYVHALYTRLSCHPYAQLFCHSLIWVCFERTSCVLLTCPMSWLVPCLLSALVILLF